MKPFYIAIIEIDSLWPGVNDSLYQVLIIINGLYYWYLLMKKKAGTWWPVHANVMIDSFEIWFEAIILAVIFYNNILSYFITSILESLYVIKFTSELRQVSSFLWVLRFPPPIKLTAIIYL